MLQTFRGLHKRQVRMVESCLILDVECEMPGLRHPNLVPQADLFARNKTQDTQMHILIITWWILSTMCFFKKHSAVKENCNFLQSILCTWMEKPTKKPNSAFRVLKYCRANIIHFVLNNLHGSSAHPWESAELCASTWIWSLSYVD